MSGHKAIAAASERIRDQIIYGKFAAINLHAGERMQRTARSPLIALSRRLAAAILTPDVRLVHQIQYEVEHMYALRDSVRSALEFFAYDIAEGDVIITADSYGGGTRGQVLTMIMPLFVEGELALFPALRVQISDLGGEIPGGFNPLAYEQWQESMRLTPVKLYVGGKLQRDVHRFLLSNSRTAEWFGADLRALYACCQDMQRMLTELFDQYGTAAAAKAADAMIAHTEAEARRFLRQAVPAARGSGSSALPDSCGSGKIKVEASWSEDRLVLDFTGTDEQINGPYNSTAALTKSVAAAAALAGCLDELPVNEGLLSALAFKLPEGSLVSPQFPSATALSGHATAHAIAAAVTEALRAAGGTAEQFPAIHGGGPWVMLYEPVGSPQVIPQPMEPGYAEVPEGWGPAALFGSGRLLSAEELETGRGFRLEKRERQPDGSMEVELKILSGTWEYQAFPYGSGSLRIERKDAPSNTENERAGSFGGATVSAGHVFRLKYAGGLAAKEVSSRGD